MKKFSIITKKNCAKCALLKTWLKDKQINYEEWKVEDKEVADRLVHDEKFIQNFCDIEGCTVYTPVIHLNETGEYFFKQLFGINGLREDYIKSLLDIDNQK